MDYQCNFRYGEDLKPLFDQINALGLNPAIIIRKLLKEFNLAEYLKNNMTKLSTEESA